MRLAPLPCKACNGQKHEEPRLVLTTPTGSVYCNGKAFVKEKKDLLFIVARDNYPLYEYLKRQLSGEDRVQVILERRKKGERRQRAPLIRYIGWRARAQGQERRKGPRRRQHTRQDDLRSYGLVVIRQQ